MLTNKLIPVVRRIATGKAPNRLYHGDKHFEPPHMNELPVPSGSWEEANNALQRKNNIHLIGGVGFLLFTIGVAKSSGLFFFNFSAPERPADA